MVEERFVDRDPVQAAQQMAPSLERLRPPLRTLDVVRHRRAMVLGGLLGVAVIASALFGRAWAVWPAALVVGMPVVVMAGAVGFIGVRFLTARQYKTGLSLLVWLSVSSGGLALLVRDLATGQAVSRPFLTMLAFAAAFAATVAGALSAVRTRDLPGDFARFAAEWAATALAVYLIAGVLLFGVAAGRHAWVQPRPVAAPTVPAGYEVYVALGDSYSAGEGLSPYLEPTSYPVPPGDDCHRSPRGFPSVLAFDGEPARRLRACSGARAGHVLEVVQPGPVDARPKELQVVDGSLGPDVDLLTISIGGNDAHFSRIVAHCYLVSRCTEAFFDPGPYETDAAYLPGPQPLAAWADAALPRIGDRVEALLTELRGRAPNARIVLVGYPPLFPTGAPRWYPFDCAVTLRKVDEGERDWLAGAQQRLNAELAEAAAGAGVEFVDPTPSWDGHASCGSGGQWINAVVPARLAVGRATYHPNAAGQQALACLVATHLVRHPTPAPADAPPVRCG